MSENCEKGWIEKLWKDPVWSKVIASIIVAIGGASLAVGVSYMHGWATIWGWVNSTWETIWRWFKVGGNLPGWEQLILWFCALGFVILCAVLARAWLEAIAKEGEVSQLSFMGLLWRWHTRRNGGIDELIHVVPFCLTCDMQIHPIRFRDVPHDHTKYFCEICPGRPLRLKFDGEHDELVDLVIREAQRQMRKGILGKAETMAALPLTPQPGELQETLFEGLRWRWRFQSGELVNIETFCPACDDPLQPYQENQYCLTQYNCRSCRASIKVFSGTHGDLQDRFVRFAKRQSRSN